MEYLQALKDMNNCPFSSVKSTGIINFSTLKQDACWEIPCPLKKYLTMGVQRKKRTLELKAQYTIVSRISAHQIPTSKKAMIKRL